MPKSHAPYAPEFRQQMIELVHAGGNPEELSDEFGCSAQSIRNWVAQAAIDGGKPAAGRDRLSSAGREELARLRRQVRQLQKSRRMISATRARKPCPIAF